MSEVRRLLTRNRELWTELGALNAQLRLLQANLPDAQGYRQALERRRREATRRVYSRLARERDEGRGTGGRLAAALTLIGLGGLRASYRLLGLPPAAFSFYHPVLLIPS